MPGTRCAAVGCSNSLMLTSQFDDTQHIQYHNIPDDSQLRKKWMQFAGMDEEWDGDISHICSIHFKSEDYKDSPEKKVLKNTAVPSLLLGTTDQGDIDCEEKSSDNDYDVDSDNSENEHIVINDGSLDYGMMNFENQDSDSENDGCDFKGKESKRKKVDDSGEFKVIACELCERKFSRKVALEHHLARIHRLSKSKIYFYLQKVVHHSAQNYKCDACKKVFYKEEKLESHLCSPAVAVMCEICQLKFTSKTGLKKHLLAVHQLGNAKVDSIMEQLVDYNSRFYKKFKVAEDIVIRSSDGRVISKKGDSQFKTTKGPRCTKCFKAFVGASELTTHICEPTIEITCEICRYKAPTKYNMKRHFTRIHKLSESDINSIMEEFSCYNEKLQLRTPDCSYNLVKKKPKRQLIKKRRDNSFCGNSESSECFQVTENVPDFQGDFSSCDEHYILSNKTKTCKKCYTTFENSFLFEEHNCQVTDRLKDNSAKRIKSIKIKKENDSENNTHVKKLVCEICQSKFSLRIALKRHLSRTHKLDADAIGALLERTSGNIDTSEFNSDLGREVSKEELFGKANLISNTIEPINCEVCHQTLYSKKDLKGHLIKCFRMKESALNLIFDESKDYYAEFYEGQNNEYNIVLSSSDGRVVCKTKNLEFTPVPGPRCKKCHKAFVDEFKIVGHECAPLITITCKICNSYTAPVKYKMLRHLMNVHKRNKNDIESVLEEFKGFNERLQLRVKNWPAKYPIKKETYQYTNYIAKESSSETEVVQFSKKNIPYKKSIKEEQVSSASESEISHIKKGHSEQFIKGEQDSQSDNDFSYSFSADEFENELLVEKSDSDYDPGQDIRSRKTMKKHQISEKSSQSEVSGDWGKDGAQEYTEIKEIVCEICKRKFCRRMSLKKHLNTIHRLNEREVDYYLRRIAHESAANFKCNVCKKQFYRESRLTSHDCSPAIAVICELCQHKLTSKISLRRHLRFSHQLEASKVNSILEELSDFNAKFYKKLKVEGDEIAICSTDGRTVSKKSGIRLTINSMNKGPRCDACYKTLNEDTLSTHECAMKIEIGCDICKYRAPSKYNLKRHLMLIHKISQNEAKLAMQEFNRYNEKMELRVYQG